MGVAQSGNTLSRSIGTDYSKHTYVVNYGTLPLNALYFDLKPMSSNTGEVDYDALTAGAPQTLARNSDDMFRLFRIGDAVLACNTHAAIFDALRLVTDI